MSQYQFIVDSYSVKIDTAEKSFKIFSSSSPENNKSLILAIDYGIGLSDESDSTDVDHLSSGEFRLELSWPNVKTLLQIDCNTTKSQFVEISFNWYSCEKWAWLRDDIKLLNDAHWFGGAESFVVDWPMEKEKFSTVPFVSGDTFKSKIGPVLERYFLSSKKCAILVKNEVPFWFGVEETSMVLQSQIKDSIYANVWKGECEFLPLKYTILLPKLEVDGEKVVSSLREFHVNIVRAVLGTPKAAPDIRMFSEPIWSTWVKFGKGVDQGKVESFANEILENGYPLGQFELDDDWSTKYGDFRFDPDKFPAPKDMVSLLKSVGFSRATIWVHPFVALDSETAKDGTNLQYFLKDQSGTPAIISWWNGEAYVVDFSSDEAVDWFANRLNLFREEFAFDAFKFDAGELEYVGRNFQFSNSSVRDPDEYSRRYAALAARFGGNVEVRVGSSSQKLPIFVRLQDRQSVWGAEDGLRSVIPAVLHFSLIGYPFCLPDMIGGNGYEGRTASKELYIRWVELNAFLPAVQFSTTPWDYDDETSEICRNVLQIRSKYSKLLFELAANCVETGEPIIRPLWFLWDKFDESFCCHDQFCVGDDLIVAPILRENVDGRRILLPEGDWRSKLDDVVYKGPTSIWQCAKIGQLPFFVRIDSRADF